jgi:hypothetical protein
MGGEGLEFAGEFLGFGKGAVEKGDSGATLEDALDGDGASCAAARADDEGVKGTQRGAEIGEDGACESGAIGVESGGLAVGEGEGVGDAQAHCGGVEVMGEGEDGGFVRNSEVDSDEVGGEGHLEGLI